MSTQRQHAFPTVLPPAGAVDFSDLGRGCVRWAMMRPYMVDCTDGASIRGPTVKSENFIKNNAHLINVLHRWQKVYKSRYTVDSRSDEILEDALNLVAFCRPTMFSKSRDFSIIWSQLNRQEEFTVRQNESGIEDSCLTRYSAPVVPLARGPGGYIASGISRLRRGEAGAALEDSAAIHREVEGLVERLNRGRRPRASARYCIGHAQRIHLL
jgi:hypothetical protein